ncbi:hypothetical protein [Sphingobium yanoikuyae]|uniref:hypothetical protein n=1 Tax=Sphingobium yanoikuyae TaxID=13690 RepID=UPI0031DCDAD0
MLRGLRQYRNGCFTALHVGRFHEAEQWASKVGERASSLDDEAEIALSTAMAAARSRHFIAVYGIRGFRRSSRILLAQRDVL